MRPSGEGTQATARGRGQHRDEVSTGTGPQHRDGTSTGMGPAVTPSREFFIPDAVILSFIISLNLFHSFRVSAGILHSLLIIAICYSKSLNNSWLRVLLFIQMPVPFKNLCLLTTTVSSHPVSLKYN